MNENINPYDLAYDYAMHTNRCMFLTGKAGTGKTTFLKRLREECKKAMVVAAPTGVAAINADGVTIHSLFQLPPQLFLPTETARAMLFSEMQMRRPKQQLLRSIEMLVIDEISMVRADLLDAVDAVLRKVRRRPTLPFGGVQVLLIGDLYQLQPVAKEQEWDRLRTFYDGPYFFQARVFKELRPVYIELDHVYRQGDADFVRLLNEVRNNCLTETGRAELNSRYQPDWEQKEGDDFHIVLSTHNKKVDTINEREMGKLKGKIYKYKAHIEGTFPESLYPMDTELELKKGARVMFIKNDSAPEKAYYNGLIGEVVEISNNEICVEVEENGQRREIEAHTETWQNIRYKAINGGESVETEVVGTFVQWPLRAAWAVTIHKAQGLTFDNVVIDAADAFASGQVYVALSRCKTLEGIVLLSKIPQYALTNAPDVISFTANQAQLQETATAYQMSERTYLLQLLNGLYDLRDALHTSAHIKHLIDTATSFNGEVAKPYADKLEQLLLVLQPTAEKFQKQLTYLIVGGEMDVAHLKERLTAAAGFFTGKLMEISKEIEESPVYTDDSNDAKDYKDDLEELYQGLSGKMWLMEKILQEVSIANWFNCRSRWKAPSLNIRVSGADSSASENESMNPKLLAQLRRLRMTIAEENGWENMVYMVASTKTLVAVSNALPTTKRELLKVSGFGPKKYELWGEKVIALVKRYLMNHKGK